MANKTVEFTQEDYDRIVTHNDVKKGMKVIYEGQENEVLCAKKGIRRMLKVPSFFGAGGFDKGDVYVWQITAVVMPDGSRKRLNLSAAAKKARQGAGRFGF